MFISREQLESSIDSLKNVHPFFGIPFLAFKKHNLPAGSTRPVSTTSIFNDILSTYYRPFTGYDGFYHPFSSTKSSQRWHPPWYGITSIQRLTTDTFGEVFIHKKNTSDWGWKLDYIHDLNLKREFKPIPAFHLAVWLYRNKDLGQAPNRADLQTALFNDFNITEYEHILFDQGLPLEPSNWLSQKPVTEEDLLGILGYPPGFFTQDAVLRSLDLKQIGPASHFHYEPASRLNIITGDNSLGKTFLLECIWWALTGQWSARPLEPNVDTADAKPSITFSVGSKNASDPKVLTSRFEREKLTWTSVKRTANAGLVIYARFDGAFTIWDSVMEHIHANKSETGSGFLRLSREEVWDGLQEDRRTVCNGLVRDWVSWQMGGRHAERWKLLLACLKELSPSQKEPLEPVEPRPSLFLDDRDIPRLQLPYGEVSVLDASAGVQRALGLAYILVWAWFRHQDYSERSKKKVRRQFVLIMDEVEAHLHPRWQRVIVPSLMKVLKKLSPIADPQIHLATHSPMVMASAETVFEQDQDALHHLKLEEGSVVLEILDFVKRGRADLWLMSSAFGLQHARSLEGEEAIEEAKRLQMQAKF